MKRIKNVFSILLFAILVLPSVTGCKKFLDRKPLTATSDDLKGGKLESQVFGLYSHMPWDWGFNLSWIDFHSIRDDDAEKGSNQTDGAEVNAEFDRFVGYTKDDWATNSYWDHHFAIITEANNALATAKEANATDEASLRNVGEALFFRAFSYFELVKDYGPVPLLTSEVLKPADAIKPKSSVEVIYAQIDSDLNVAAQYLPLTSSEYGTGFDGRLTKGAANTLWAQTYLFRKNWDKVVELCNQVIASGKYSLATNFTDLWKAGPGGSGHNGPESIWEVQTSVGANAANNSAVDYGTMWQVCQGIRQGGATNDWNLGWGWNTPTDHLVTEWDATDPRKNQTILYSGQSDGGPSEGGYGLTLPPYSISESGGIARRYWNKKVYADPAMKAFTGQLTGNADWLGHRILRYADVLLMLAEAANEMGDGATAETNLELVRNRASGNLGTGRTILPHIAYISQAQMRTAIKNERRWEFAMEGYRFYDLVRWTPATDGIDAPNILGPLGYQPKNALYPIPQHAIDLSVVNGTPVLIQNPDY
jgi:starch-binding outer membrane protein, SusD/RagB family